MYNTLKRIAKSIIPKAFLFKNELFFRSFYSYFYRGKSHECVICKQQLKAFVATKTNDLLCPSCGSLSRTRRLYNELQKNELVAGNVLHFSPSRSLFRIFKTQKGFNYYSTDFTDAFLADYKFDITKIEQPNKTFDFILCYHILEHIIEDAKAIKELYRVLKPNGICYIQTPFKDGTIYEDYTITTPEERFKHFGQDDHVRIYSVKGLKNRLQAENFKVEVQNLEKNEFYGFIAETILVCRK